MSLRNKILPLAGKILALDLGTRRTGVAVSDVKQQVAFPRDEIEHESKEELIKLLKAMVLEEFIVGILVGLPVSMEGKNTEQTEITHEIISALKEAVEIPVEMVDERLTTYEARKTSLGSAAADSRAAQIMLEMYIATSHSSG